MKWSGDILTQNTPHHFQGLCSMKSYRETLQKYLPCIFFFLFQKYGQFWSFLTQCARIRVPLVVMKIVKFKDLFRAALDRWLDSHESKNFGLGRTRRPIRPDFSAILPILGKIEHQKNDIKCSLLTLSS